METSKSQTGGGLTTPLPLGTSEVAQGEPSQTTGQESLEQSVEIKPLDKNSKTLSDVVAVVNPFVPGDQIQKSNISNTTEFYAQAPSPLYHVGFQNGPISKFSAAQMDWNHGHHPFPLMGPVFYGPPALLPGPPYKFQGGGVEAYAPPPPPGVPQYPPPFFSSMPMVHVEPTTVLPDPSEVRYSGKVFLGGLPAHCTSADIISSFQRFMPFTVSWPQQNAEGVKNYAFLIFSNPKLVNDLVNACINVNGTLGWIVSSDSVKFRAVQIRPWKLSDAFWSDETAAGAQSTFVVGLEGVPKSTTAKELGAIIQSQFGSVASVAIEMDELHYPTRTAYVTLVDFGAYQKIATSKVVNISVYETPRRVRVFLNTAGQGKKCYCGQNGVVFCKGARCLRHVCSGCWKFVHYRH